MCRETSEGILILSSKLLSFIGIKMFMKVWEPLEWENIMEGIDFFLSFILCTKLPFACTLKVLC